ncbi:hypothetical protein K6T82_21245 [Flavobacterium sp. 17A]|uniref:Uncharacterized protein n=1 Tax=Flavobacterium potami TaxID=2872310 RepID=A0A9X1KS73_9FLAO|nr:hypothetical protein [Flavobacterium potami]MBZ4037300.1 hypothetical protein [Flavobacterium potami]
MKTSFEIEIDPSSLSIFFPKYRLKDKFQILDILLESARYIIHGKREEKVKSVNKIVFFREKMNRVFFVSEDKIYSITFPFNLIIGEEGEVTLNFKNLIEIDSYAISSLIILLKNPLINSDNCLDFIDPVIDLENESNSNYWPVLKDLIMLEDGYLRYDMDEKGFKEASEKQQQHRHPLHHIDVFYTNGATFKLGLEKSILDNDLIDILDSSTNCKFLRSIN